MIHWFVENLQWILSGIGISCIVCLWILCKTIVRRFVVGMITRRTTAIHLRIGDELMLYHESFGVLHVRDGKDQLADPDRGLLLNKVRKTSRTGTGTIRTKIRFSKNLGFQFKCFFDHGDALPYEEAKRLLEKAGYIEVSRGEGARKRVWFIHPDFPTCKTVDGIMNNFFFPQ